MGKAAGSQDIVDGHARIPGNVPFVIDPDHYRASHVMADAPMYSKGAESKDRPCALASGSTDGLFCLVRVSLDQIDDLRVVNAKFPDVGQSRDAVFVPTPALIHFVH